MTQALVINCSAGYQCGGVHFMRSAEGSRLVDCHIQGCHTMDAWSNGQAGGLELFYGGSLTMIGGSITGCRASDLSGGVWVRAYATLSLIDVLVADCHSNAKTGGGGGISVSGDGTLIMSGGAIRNCHALNGGNGGGLNVEGEVQLSGTTVQGCTASTANGGGMWFSGAQAQLNEVTVQGCAATHGGGMHIDTSYVYWLAPPWNPAWQSSKLTSTSKT